jgi:hypothetical protein
MAGDRRRVGVAMMADELAPRIEKYPTAPKGWEPLATLPIKEYRAPVEYLMANGNRRATLGVSNLDFFWAGEIVAWRRLTRGPLYGRYLALLERDANMVAAYG